MVQIALYIVIGLLGLGLLAMVAFGVRSLTYGKIDTMTMIFMAVPIVILLLLGLIMPSWAEAGIMTILITLGLALLALLYTGAKGLFS